MWQGKWGGRRQIEFDKRMKGGKGADSPVGPGDGGWKGQQWKGRRRRVGSTVRLYVFRSKAHRSVLLVLPPGKGIVTRTKAQSSRENEFCNSSVKLLRAPDAKWHQPFMKWNRSGSMKLPGRDFYDSIQTPFSNPRCSSYDPRTLNAFSTAATVCFLDDKRVRLFSPV